MNYVFVMLVLSSVFSVIFADTPIIQLTDAQLAKLAAERNVVIIEVKNGAQNITTLHSSMATQAQATVTPPSNPVIEPKQSNSWFSDQYSIQNALLAIGVVYAAVNAYLYSRAYSIKNNLAWSSWKDSIALEQLVLQADKALAQDLFSTIGERYSNKTYFLEPIVAFCNDIEKEKKELNSFIATFAVLKKTKLHYVFPSYEATIALANMKLKRLHFLLDLLMNWMSEYKVEAPAMYA